MMGSKKINFVTFYPRCHNPGLMKDVGQIPNTLGKNYDEVDAKLVSCIVEMRDKNIQYLTGMKVEKIPFILRSNQLTGLLYIIKNAKKVDWFNFYHGGRKVYYWTKLYKFLNPKGKVYLKMDLSYEGCKKYSSSRKEHKIFEKTAEAVDIISVESEVIKNAIKGFSSRDIALVYNGYFDSGNMKIRNTSEREKAFITVGRLGTHQKASDLLLEAFAITAPEHDWKLKLVGPVDKAFMKYIDDFFARHSELRERVDFAGMVSDKDRLYQFYNASRVFVLPSRWEGFPLVGPEALHCGCRMILTDIIPPIKELTNNGEFGISVKTNDINALADALLRETNRVVEDEEPQRISEYAARNLSWDGICSNLYSRMVDKMEIY